MLLCVPGVILLILWTGYSTLIYLLPGLESNAVAIFFWLGLATVGCAISAAVFALVRPTWIAALCALFSIAMAVAAVTRFVQFVGNLPRC